ncbi:hypothetical protein KY290_000816 [Solanum tuberosum]|uniref:Uncharacterized protein n=1 Tax=Solanum tuberosum TaxID=4113 RepID=A0ABQ7WKJ2_SOLTU|nr:hypothetical protein KY290_000816 [Solanum tuberosum]
MDVIPNPLKLVLCQPFEPYLLESILQSSLESHVNGERLVRSPAHSSHSLPERR